MEKEKKIDRIKNSVNYNKDVDLNKMTLYWNEMAEDDLMQIAHAENIKKFEERAIINVNKFIKLLRENKSGLNDLRILDVGCGIGRMVKEFSKRGIHKEIVGVDVSNEMCKKGEKYCKDIKDVIFKKTSGADLKELESNSFDFVYSYITFQHFPRSLARNYMKEIARVLKKNGIAIIHFPSLSLLMQKNKYVKPMEPPQTNYRWMRYYKTSEVAEVFEDFLHIKFIDDSIFVVGEKRW